MTDTVFSNYTNYIYKIKQTGDQDLYLLFNPSIHYWISIDETGKEICEQLLSENSLNTVKEKLINLFKINSKIFDDEILPYIQTLFEKGFFKHKSSASQAEYMNNISMLTDIDKYPFNEMYISLTDMCNLNCLYCFNKEKRKTDLSSDNYKAITYEEICSAVIQFKELGGNRIVLTGGEPTLNKDFERICKFVHANGLKLSFITNGLTLLHKDLNAIFPYVTSVGLSLDSVFANELDTLWGIESKNISHTMISVLKRIDNWSEKNKMISVNIMPISSNVNYRSMSDTIHTIAMNLTHCNVTWQIVKYDKLNKPQIDQMLEISNEQYFNSIIEGLSVITDISDKSKYIKVLQYAYSSSGRLLPAKAPKIYTCIPSFFITASGDIKPCQGLDNIALGNIRCTSLKEAFASDGFGKVQKYICKNHVKICKDCEFRFVCEAENRECYKYKSPSKEECRSRMIYQLYLETLNQE